MPNKYLVGAPEEIRTPDPQIRSLILESSIGDQETPRLLMNHSLPGVNAGYITRDRLLRDHLRQQQQRISELVVRSGTVDQDSLLVVWRFGSTKVDETANQISLTDIMRPVSKNEDVAVEGDRLVANNLTRYNEIGLERQGSRARQAAATGASWIGPIGNIALAASIGNFVVTAGTKARPADCSVVSMEKQWQ